MSGDAVRQRFMVDMGARSREALEPTGFSFGSQAELRDHLFTVQHPQVT